MGFQESSSEEEEKEGGVDKAAKVQRFLIHFFKGKID